MIKKLNNENNNDNLNKNIKKKINDNKKKIK